MKDETEIPCTSIYFQTTLINQFKLMKLLQLTINRILVISQLPLTFFPMIDRPGKKKVILMEKKKKKSLSIGSSVRFGNAIINFYNDYSDETKGLDMLRG